MCFGMTRGCRAESIFAHLLYESESDEKLSFEAYHGPATKEGGHKVIPRPLTVNPNITRTRAYLQFHQVSVLAILIFELVPRSPYPRPIRPTTTRHMQLKK